MRKRMFGTFVVLLSIVIGALVVSQPASASTPHKAKVVRINSGVVPGTSLPNTSESKALLATAAASSSRSLTVGPIHDSGKQTCPPWSRPHCYTVIEVYWRGFASCYASVVIKQCQNGAMVYAPGWTVCGTTCHLGGLYGSHACDLGDSHAFGYTYDVTACNESRVKNLSALVMRDTIRVCSIPPLYCNKWGFHNNEYYTAAITGPYGGEGSFS